MTEMNEEQVQAFVVKLRNVASTPDERELLDAVLKVAGDIADASAPAFQDEFAGSFTKRDADLVLEYSQLMLATGAENTILRPVYASPPTIIRTPPDPHDD